MANLQLVGAVGVRVRPDTDGFRNEAKREILAQLKDIEGDVNVKVSPNVQYQEAEALRAFNRAFKDIEVDQNVLVNTKVDFGDFDQTIQQKIDSLTKEVTSVRIELETGQAEQELTDLSRQIDDIRTGLTRWPTQLEIDSESYSKIFDNLEQSTLNAQNAVEEYELKISELNETIERSGQVSKTSAAEQRTAMERLRQAVQEQVDAEIEIERLRVEYRLASGKAAKDAVRQERLRAEAAQAAAKESVTSIRTEIRALEQRAAAAEKESTRSAAAIEKITQRLKTQREIIKSNTETLADQRAGYDRDVTQLEEKIRLETERLSVLEEQLAVETELQNARSKSNQELQETITSLPVHEWDRYMDAVKNGLTTSKDYFDWLKRRNKELTREQIAAIDEVAQRRAEAHEEAMAQAEAMDQVYAEYNVEEIKTIFSPELNGIAAAGVEAKLAAMARDRMVKFKAQEDLAQRVPVDLYIRNSAQFTRDVSRAMSGMGLAKDMSRSIRNTTRDMDVMSISAAQLAVAIGTLTAGLGGTVGLASTLAADIGELSGAMLMLPALVTGLGSAAYVTFKGFENFKAAAQGSAEALATFGEDGQAAAIAMGDLGQALTDNIKPAFWEGIGDSMTTMLRTIQGPVVQGLTEAGEAMGNFFEGIFTSLENFASSGMMAEAFSGMNEGLRNLSGAAEPLFDAINRIGLAGSRHLPALGQAAADAAQRFDDWAVAAEEAGKMDEWILTAGNHMESLGSITASTVGVIASLAAAAERAGFGGINTIAEAMRDVNDAAKSEFFQGNMANILEGSLDAVQAFGRGFRELGAAILEESKFIERALQDIGTVGENALNALADAFSNQRFQGGVAEFLNDIAEASERLGPIMQLLASGFGDFAGVAGEVVKGAAQIAESFLHVLDGSENLSGAIEKVVPVLMNFTAAAVELAHGPMGLLMDALTVLLEGFAALPGPIQTAAIAFALLAVNANKIRGVGMWVADLGRAFKGANLAGSAAAMTAGLSGLATAADRSSSRVHTAFSRMGDGARKAVSGMSGLKAAGAGLFGLMGGAWGVALAGVVTALVTFSQQAGETRTSVNAIKDSFDEMGQATDATARTIADSLNEMKSNWQDVDARTFLPWVEGPETVGEALKELGLTSAETADMLLNDRDAYMELANAMADLGKGVKPSEDALQRLSEITGISTDRLAEMAPHLGMAGDNMLRMADNVSAAESSFASLNGATQPASQSAQDLAEAFATMGDEASSTSDKVNALKDAIEILNGGSRTAAEASIAANQAIREAGESAAAATQQYGDLSAGLKQVGDGFELDTATEQAAQLADVLTGLVDPAMEAAVALSEQGASAAEVAAPLENAKAAWMGMAEQMGLVPAEAQAVWDQLVGMNPEEIVTTLKVEGGEAVEQASSLANTLGVEFSEKEFVAWLEADASNAELATEDAKAAAEAFVNQEYLADLGVDVATFDAAMAEAEARGKTWDSEEFQAWLTADGTEAEIAGKSAQEIARMFADDTYGAKLTADGSQASSEIESINTKLASLKDPFLITGTLTADDSEFEAVMIAAEAKGAAITDPAAFRAFLTANAEEFHAESATVDEILNAWATLPHEVRVGAETSDAQLKLDNVRTALDTVSGTPATATVAEQGADLVSQKVETVKVSLGQIDGRNVSATISAVDAASSVITVPLAAAEQFAKDYNGTITATDSASAIISVPKAQAEQFAKNYAATITATDVATGQITVPKALADSYVKNYQAQITATDGASATIQVPAIMATQFAKSYNATMSAVDGASAVITLPKSLAETYAKQYNATMVASDGASGTIAIPQSAADQFVKDYNAGLTATDGATAPITSVQGVADALVKDYNANMTATDSASGTIGGVQGSANDYVGPYNADMTSTDSASGTISSVQRAANDIIGNYNANVTATDNASGVLSGIVGWLNDIRQGAVAAVRSVFNANGNLIDSMGRIMEFAKGGFAFRAFADGGVTEAANRTVSRAQNSWIKESHLAQISRPVTPFRIWAEPETGGESYIPLSSSKRARSTRIWEETGNRLGVNIEQYAAGGIKAGKINGNRSAPGAGSGIDGRGAVSINVVNHYPQAEPTSTTTNRTLQLAANLLG